MTSLRLAPLAPETLRADQRQLYDAILGGKRSTGHVGVALTLPNGALVGPFNPMLLSPQLGTAVQRVGEEVRFASLLSPEIKEILILLVAEKTASSFERYAHEAIARIQGMNELRIEQLRSGQKPTAMSAQEDAAWSIGHDLLAQNKVSDDSYAKAKDALGEQGLFEAAVLVGYYRMIAGVLGTFGVEAPQG